MAGSELDPSASPLAFFGSELRRLRVAKNVTQEELGKACRVTKQQISMIENAKRTPHIDFTQMAEEFLGLDGELMRPLGLVHRTGPIWFREWPKIEANAHNLRTWQPLVVPGLLQTRPYARAILRGEPVVSDDLVDETADSRIARQVIFDRTDPPMYVAVMDESVLTRPIGGNAVMREQIEHLIKMADHPSITIQLVRTASVPTVGLLGGFVIAQQTHGSDVVYLDSAADGEVNDREERVRRVSVRFDTIRSFARPVDETTPELRKKLEMYQDE